MLHLVEDENAEPKCRILVDHRRCSRLSPSGACELTARGSISRMCGRRGDCHVYPLPDEMRACAQQTLPIISLRQSLESLRIDDPNGRALINLNYALRL